MGFYLSCAFALLRNHSWYCISVSYLYSLCWSFRTCLNYFTKARFCGMKHSYDIWLSSGTELCGRAENISDTFRLHIWYLHPQQVWHLEFVSLVFCSMLNRKKDTTECWPPLLLFWWCICERPRILNLNKIHSVYSLTQVSKQFWR